MVTRLIVEPHPDDAFLSLGEHIEKAWKEDQIYIVSVYADKRRTSEAVNYAAAVGAGSFSFELVQSKMKGERGKGIEPTLNHQLTSLCEKLDVDVVLLPLGLQHPDHLRVSKAKPKGNHVLRYYVDTPYQLKLKNGQQLRERTTGMVVDSMLYPSARKYRHAEIFKSQSKFFHFNPPEKIRTMEMVLRK